MVERVLQTVQTSPPEKEAGGRVAPERPGVRAKAAAVGDGVDLQNRATSSSVNPESGAILRSRSKNREEEAATKPCSAVKASLRDVGVAAAAASVMLAGNAMAMDVLLGSSDGGLVFERSLLFFLKYLTASLLFVICSVSLFFSKYLTASLLFVISSVSLLFFRNI